jgi:hypothetical protein
MQATYDKNNTGTEGAEVDRRYRRIGISAVAAALRYQSEAKNPAYAPAAAKPRAHAEDTEG